MEEPKKNQKIRMLSPVTVYSTLNTGRTIYFAPYNHDFRRIIKENLLKKYKAFYKEDITDIDFELYTLSDKYQKVITKYEGFIIEGWMGDFILKGSEEIIKLAYDTGIGAKNSQGFGCFELL